MSRFFMPFLRDLPVCDECWVRGVWVLRLVLGVVGWVGGRGGPNNVKFYVGRAVAKHDLCEYIYIYIYIYLFINICMMTKWTLPQKYIIFLKSGMLSNYDFCIVVINKYIHCDVLD